MISCHDKSEADIFDKYLKKMQEANDSLLPLKTLDYAYKALEIAQNEDDSQMLSQVYLELAVAYTNLGLYQESLSYVNLAQNESYTETDIDLKLELYSNKSYIYRALGLYDLARNESERIINEIKRDNESVLSSRRLARAVENIGIAYSMQYETTDSVYKYSDKAIQILKKHPKAEICEDLSLSYLQKAQSFVIDRNFDSAYYNINRSFSLLKECNISYPMDMYFQELGNYYYSKEDYDKALQYYFKTLEELKINNLNDSYSIDVYKSIADIYHELGKADKEKEYLTIYAEKINFQSLEDKKNTAYALKLLMEYEEREKKTLVKRFYKILLIVLPMVLILTLYFFKEKRKRKENESRSVKLLKIKEEETITLKQKVNESFDEILQLAKENHPHFWVRFQEVYPKFRSKLLSNCKTLKTSELTFCAYVYLGFTTKEIASYTFRAPKTIENNRYNVRKKLGLKPEQDFLIWLHDFVDRD